MKNTKEIAKGLDKFYADKETKRNYVRDKRVTQWDKCDCCGTPISKSMAKRLGGYCQPCIDSQN